MERTEPPSPGDPARNPLNASPKTVDMADAGTKGWGPCPGERSQTRSRSRSRSRSRCWCSKTEQRFPRIMRKCSRLVFPLRFPSLAEELLSRRSNKGFSLFVCHDFTGYSVLFSTTVQNHVLRSSSPPFSLKERSSSNETDRSWSVRQAGKLILSIDSIEAGGEDNDDGRRRRRVRGGGRERQARGARAGADRL